MLSSVVLCHISVISLIIDRITAMCHDLYGTIMHVTSLIDRLICLHRHYRLVAVLAATNVSTAVVLSFNTRRQTVPFEQIENQWSVGHALMPSKSTTDWIGLSSVLRLHQHSIGYMGDGFHRLKDPTNSIKVLKEQIVQRQIKHAISRHEHKTQQVP